MGRFCVLSLISFAAAAVPMLGQTSIGGGTCSSSSLNGPYEFILNGRQVTANGTVSKVFQEVGTATFDGLSKVTFNGTTNVVSGAQIFGTPALYSGNYSLQSNCVGSITLNSGSNATFTIEVFSQGVTFALIGSDASYAYNGSGNAQATTCSAIPSGSHEFSASGSALAGQAVTGVLDLTGLLQFDGKGNLTANWTQVLNLINTTVSATGTYTVTSNCQVSATLTDALNNKYTLTFVIYGASENFVLAGTSPISLFDGTASVALPASQTCDASKLNGVYEISLSARFAPAGIITRFFTSNGSATFDGKGKVTFNLTANSVNGTPSLGAPLVYSGTYSVQSNCQGTITITTGNNATFAFVAFNINATTQQARAFNLVGTDLAYAYNGGGNIQPTACATSSLSGPWVFSATGYSYSGVTNTGIVDVAGVLQFDGVGNVTTAFTAASSTATLNVTGSGTYSVGANCLGSITLTDFLNNKYSLALSVFGAAGANVDLVVANSSLILTGAARAPFSNPGQAVVNAASFLPDQTPAGSVFSIFGTNLATKVGQPSAVPLPTTVLTTSVTVNGVLAPLFYVDPNQINAQMPQEIKPGVATVVVKNGSSTSNSVAVLIPATGTPGIVVYGNSRAVVVNPNGSVNAPTAPAKVGDTLVAYFTGGGPVTAAGPLVTGSPAPLGLSPVSGPYTVKLGGVEATVSYMGLTPGSIGLYQVNFVVPKVAAGDRALILSIAGQNSNNPLVAVSN